MAKPRKSSQGASCGRSVGTLTAEKRKKIPARLFGLPEIRAYPMPDVAHAKSAKSRAGAALKTGRLSVRDYERIVRKANRIVTECQGNPHKNSAHPSHRCPVGTRIQSVLVPLTEGSTRARSWVRAHGFRDKLEDPGGDYYHFRQRAPASFVPGSFRTISLGDGRKGVIGCPRRRK